jgi:hypothetical protein
VLRDLGQLVVADEDATLPAVGWRDALFEQIYRADIEAAIASIDGLVSARRPAISGIAPALAARAHAVLRPAAADHARRDTSRPDAKPA